MDIVMKFVCNYIEVEMEFHKKVYIKVCKIPTCQSLVATNFGILIHMKAISTEDDWYLIKIIPHFAKPLTLL